MQKYNEYQKIVAILLSVIIMLEFSGCYSIRAIPKGEIQYASAKCYYVHGSKSFYRIDNVKISDGILTGSIRDNPADPKKGQEVHIYLAPDSAVKETGDIVRFPFKNIAKVEVYKVDGGKTATFILAGAYGAFFIVGLIVLLTKGLSCPFIYSDDGLNMNFEGEIYSGATAVPLERDDYLRLKSLKPVDDSYRIMLTNEVNEIQNTNLAELLVFDHPAGTDLLVDKYGNAHSVSDIRKPLRAADSYGRSLLNEFSRRDSIRYISDLKNDPVLRDTISLTFEKPPEATSSKLVISGKNTMWLDYIFGRFTDLFGRRYDNWKEMRNKKSKEELLQWMSDQGMPLAVYLETGSGLKFIDNYNLPGPMADREDVLLLDLSGVTGNTVKLKLVAGLLFWDLDFIGMDFSADQAVNKNAVPVSSATDEKNKDVASLLRLDDDRYLIQPDGNNQTTVTFPAISSLPGMSRSFFLHTRGNYEVLRDARGKPDIAYLKTFLEPGSFIKFSKDHILKYYLNSN